MAFWVVSHRINQKKGGRTGNHEEQDRSGATAMTAGVREAMHLLLMSSTDLLHDTVP